MSSYTFDMFSRCFQYLWLLFILIYYIYIIISYPMGSMYAIYGNIYHQYTPNVSIYTSTMDPMGMYNYIILYPRVS
jgi:hypothetical protein